jgi:outer membrane protein OmpA-like peptidoglycan-associated protein
LAQASWEKKEDPAKVNHLAYMASQRVTIAQDTASSVASQAITANAKAERDKLLLAVRTSEANQAEARATQSEQRNRLAAEALAAAQIQATESTRQHEIRVGELEAELKSLNAKQTERGIVISLGDVLFNTGKAEISMNAAPTMSKLANFLNRYPQQRALIEGHTDNTGSEAGNYALSQRRADAVQIALLNLGVKRNQLSTQAFGQNNPVADNSTAVGRQLNRRVDIVFEQVADKVSDRE